MKYYVGTKYLQAAPMTRGQYNAYRGWQTPADEEPEDAGYLVEYNDGGPANHPDHVGYISWSPKVVFERTYRELLDPVSWRKSPVELDFGAALRCARAGAKIRRTGWNGAGMHVFLDEPQEGPDGIAWNPCFVMFTAKGEFQPGWLASQADMLADDWIIVESGEEK